MTSNAYKKFITMLNGADVAKHNSINSCFVVIHGQAYDVTEFLDEHPGGARSILRYGGKVGRLTLSAFMSFKRKVRMLPQSTSQFIQRVP